MNKNSSTAHHASTQTDSLDGSTGGTAAEELLRKMAAGAGMEHFLLASFPRGDNTAFAGNQLICNWPTELVDAYAASDSFHSSMLVTALKQTNLPVCFGAACFASSAANEENKEMSAQFADHGLLRTIAFSLHDANLNHFVFAFSGRRASLSRQERMELVYGSMQVLDNLARARGEAERPAERLTPRELECLRWSACGKSSDEIAIILHLSSHTVGSYLKTAMRKLDSVNRMQAVARAFRYRLL